MPTRRFALAEGGEERLAVEWKRGWKDIRVTLDEDELGVIPNRDVLRYGKEFTLPDGKTLLVMQRPAHPEGLDVLLNNEPLAGSSSDPNKALWRAVGPIFFVAALSMAVGIGAMAGVAFLEQLALGWVALLAGVVMAVLGFLVLRWHSKVALGIAVVLFALDGVVGVLAQIEIGGRPPPLWIIFRIVLILAMISGFRAINGIKRTERRHQEQAQA